jgi:hypothetical protein
VQPVLLEISRNEPRTTIFTGVTFDATGNLIVTGWSTDENGRPAVALVRVSPNGALDTSFASSGSQVVQLGLGPMKGSIAFEIGPRPAGTGWLVAGNASGLDGRIAMLSAAFERRCVGHRAERWWVVAAAGGAPQTNKHWRRRPDGSTSGPAPSRSIP